MANSPTPENSVPQQETIDGKPIEKGLNMSDVPAETQKRVEQAQDAAAKAVEQAGKEIKGGARSGSSPDAGKMLEGLFGKTTTLGGEWKREASSSPDAKAKPAPGDSNRKDERGPVASPKTGPNAIAAEAKPNGNPEVAPMPKPVSDAPKPTAGSDVKPMTEDDMIEAGLMSRVPDDQTDTSEKAPMPRPAQPAELVGPPAPKLEPTPMILSTNAPGDATAKPGPTDDAPVSTSKDAPSQPSDKKAPVSDEDKPKVKPAPGATDVVAAAKPGATEGADEKKENPDEPKTEMQRIAKEVLANINVLKDPKATKEQKEKAVAGILGSVAEFIGRLNTGTLLAKSSLGVEAPKKPGEEAKAPEKKNETAAQSRERLEKELKPGETMTELRDRKASDKATAEADVKTAATSLDAKKGEVAALESKVARAEAGTDAEKVTLDADRNLLSALKKDVAALETSLKEKQAKAKALDMDIKELDEMKSAAEKGKKQLEDILGEARQQLIEKDGKPKDGATDMVNLVSTGKLEVDANFVLKWTLTESALVVLRQQREKNKLPSDNASIGIDSKGVVTSVEKFMDTMKTLGQKVKDRVS
jgi:hypothetical protein